MSCIKGNGNLDGLEAQTTHLITLVHRKKHNTVEESKQ